MPVLDQAQVLKWTQLERSDGDGSWPKGISKEKIALLWLELESLIEKYFDADSDGDLPIDLHMVDRTKYQRLHYTPIPYDHKNENDLDRVVELSLLNLNIAQEDFNRAIRAREYVSRQQLRLCERCGLQGGNHTYKSGCIKALQALRARINKAEEVLQKSK